ncbi:MAG TPA: hypothetical protein PKD92_03665 [Novosphingobium sp.]|nr:hypothetical protein [Novosphingobium sp.]
MDAERILSAASQTLARQRAGGRRLPAIGRRSVEMRLRHWARKLLRMGLGAMAVIVGAIVAGTVMGGIGFGGIMLPFLALLAVVGSLAWWPRFKVPDRAALNRGTTRTMIANTEVWLEAQRPALPAPAVAIVQDLGRQLDTLGRQLEGIDDKRPQVAEVRKLVGEYLPEVGASYTAIPPHLRAERSGGASPDEAVTESLGRISAEIDTVTRQIAAGEIDRLAIRTRYLDYKYGAGPEGTVS